MIDDLNNAGKIQVASHPANREGVQLPFFCNQRGKPSAKIDAILPIPQNVLKIGGVKDPCSTSLFLCS